MSKPFFVEPHSVFRVRHGLSLDPESIVSQEHLNECDVTVILARYQRTGQLPPGRGQGFFEDVSSLCGSDYSDVVNAVRSANDAVETAKLAEFEAAEKVKAFEAASAVPPAASAAS